MKIPTLKEIKIINFSVPELIESLKLQEAGRYPTYIKIDTASRAETIEVLDNIATAFIQLNLNPKFPYPFYVVTDKVRTHSIISICSSVEQLPKHFNRKAGRLRGQELLLLNKTNLLKDKVINLPFFELTNKINKSTRGQRNLYKITKQLNFLETILKKLHKRADDER